MLLGTVAPTQLRRDCRAAASWLRWAPTRGRRALARARDDVPQREHVALTFDDGPDPEFTPRILDVLAAHGVSATFFVVGSRVRAYPGLVRRAKGEGHGLGSHSLTHPDARRVGARALRLEYANGRRALEDVIGDRVPLFRPPNGTVDLRGAVVMRSLGLVPWLWTVDPRDYDAGTTSADIIRRCARAQQGDVVLLHDGLQCPRTTQARDRSATVTALPRIIASLQDRGLRLGPIPF